MKKETRFFLIFLAGLFALPFVTKILGAQLWAQTVSVGSYCLIYLVAAQALNVQVGMTGLLNLGPIAFVGIGAYTGALLLTLKTSSGSLALVSFYASILPELSGHARWILFFLDPNFLAYLTVAPFAVVMAILLSLLIGLPTLKLTGDYFAIVTLGFAQIFYLIVKNEAWLTKGAFGVKDIPPLFSFCTECFFPRKASKVDRNRSSGSRSVPNTRSPPSGAPVNHGYEIGRAESDIL